MHFSDKAKKLVCLCVAVAMIVPVFIGIVMMFVK